MIDRIISARKAIDEYRRLQSNADTAGHERLLNELIEKLKQLGFESIDDFFSKNRQAILEDISKTIKFEGKCDMCVGRKPGCAEFFPDCLEKGVIASNATRTDRITLEMYDSKVTRKYLYRQGYLEGKAVPLYPNCAITIQRIKEPALDWRWR